MLAENVPATSQSAAPSTTGTEPSEVAEPAVAGLPHARPSRSLDSDVLARAEQMQTRMLFIAEEQHPSR